MKDEKRVCEAVGIEMAQPHAGFAKLDRNNASRPFPRHNKEMNFE